MAEKHLLVAVARPFFFRVAHAFTSVGHGRVPPAEQEITLGSGGQCNAACRIPRDEGTVVVDDVELAVPRIIDNDLTELLVEIERVDVNPVAAPASTEIHIQFLGMIPHHAVVGLRGVDVLYEMIGNVPLPDDIAVEIELDDAVGPRRVIVPLPGIGASRDGLFVRDGPAGHAEYRARLELLVPDLDEVMMMGVARARIDDLAVSVGNRPGGVHTENVKVCNEFFGCGSIVRLSPGWVRKKPLP